MQAATLQHSLIPALEIKLGLRIPTYQGAAVIHFDNQQEIGLEFSTDSSLFVLHSPLMPLAPHAADLWTLQTILRLNSRIDLLQGGWLGVHTASNTLRYFFAIPSQHATTELVLQLVNTLLSVKQSIVDKIRSGAV
jgi:hypothetical protein